MQFDFIVCLVEVYWNILKLSCRPLTFTLYKAFLKNKKRSWTIIPASFSARLSKKLFLLFYAINWWNFFAWLPLFLEIVSNMCIVVVWFAGCDVINFEINLHSNEAIFPTWPKSQDKSFNIFRMTRAFKVKTRKHFSSFLKGFYWIK